jgi:hypothetical protein
METTAFSKNSVSCFGFCKKLNCFPVPEWYSERIPVVDDCDLPSAAPGSKSLVVPAREVRIAATVLYIENRFAREFLIRLIHAIAKRCGPVGFSSQFSEICEMLWR